MNSKNPIASPKDRESLMVALERAFGTDDGEGALAISNELIARFPDDTECLCLHASALDLCGETDEALDFCGQALDRHPDALDLIQQTVELLVQVSEGAPDALEEAIELLERGCALGEKSIERRGDQGEAGDVAPDGSTEQLSDLYLLTTDVFTLLGEPARALAAAKKAQALFPEDPDVRVNMAMALFELCRFEEARVELEAALRDDPDNAWALHHYGLVHDHLGLRTQADALLQKAHELDPETCPAQVKVSAKAFEKTLEKAIASLPDKVRNYIKNVVVLVEDLPVPEELLLGDPPLSPNSLGMFRGTPGPMQSVTDPWSIFPSSIVLFQRNLERFARDRDDLVEQISVTLLHEVGHFLGLDENEVAALGLA